MSGYKSFVSSKWRSFQVEGRGGYVIKEKLKLIKVALREWHSTHTNYIPTKISQVKDHISVLDEKGEVSSLEEEEVEELHGLTAELHSLSRVNSSIFWQQSHLNWLQEGDANSKYFHGSMSCRRWANAISTIVVEVFKSKVSVMSGWRFLSIFRITIKLLKWCAPGQLICNFPPYLLERGQP